MPTTVAIKWISWNHARLLALLLNALTGLDIYFDSSANDLSLNELFGLRKSQIILNQLDIQFSYNGMDKEIFNTIRTLSKKTDILINRGIDRLAARNSKLSEEAYFLVNPLRRTLSEYRKLDERLRWPSKSVEFNSKQPWIDSVGHGRFFECLRELKTCELSAGCLDLYAVDFVPHSTTVSTQLVYLSTAEAFGCTTQLNKYISERKTKRAIDLNELTTELCTNFFDETAKLRKDRRKLARSGVNTLQSIMEQMSVCSQLGFVEFIDPHLLELIFSWQDPKTGGFMGTKPEPVPSHHILQPLDDVKPPEKLPFSSSDEINTPHRSMLAFNVLTNSLRLLINPPSWPELRLHDQVLIVQMDQIPAEDKFKSFRYIKWVEDSNLPTDLRLRPPPFAWSPDLIALVILMFVFVAGSVVFIYIFTPSYESGTGPRPHNVKQFYKYAYKRL